MIDVGFRLPFIEYVLVHLKMNLVIFGFRGYGKSEGTPSEEGVYLDGLAMTKYVFEDKEAEKVMEGQLLLELP